ncbi:MAG: DUF3990 domain-containing protein [Deferribacteraceae bacterium]|jgi:hypothetical protein|nr:DUF3990 domain-containing protein [Deferribacteraceae bacterium]
MKIYHGSYATIKNPEIRASANNKDFGQGFYCTELQLQAERWSMRFQTPIVSIFDCILQSDLNILSFDTMTDKWLDFIADCRAGKPHQYDIVIGAMADDQIWNYLADFISGILTREQFWILAKFKHPTHQISFCSTKALKCLQFLESYTVEL